MNLGQMRTRFLMYMNDPRAHLFAPAEQKELLHAGAEDCAEIINQSDEEFFRGIKCYAVVSGTDLEFDLPDDFLDVMSIERLGGTKPIPLENVHFKRRHYDDEALTTYYTPDSYYISGDKLGIPYPTESYTIRLAYVKSIALIEDDTLEYEIPRIHHDLVCLKAAKRGYGISQRPWPSALGDTLDEKERKLVFWIEGRAAGATPLNADVDVGAWTEYT